MTETSKSRRAKDLCLASETKCKYALDKMIKGEYRAKYKGGDGDDDITVVYEEKTGEYHLSEGKHRVCAAKRFNIDSIPVIMIINNTKEYACEEREGDAYDESHVEITDYKAIVKDYYRICNRIGLNHEQALKMLNYDGDDIIDFIEKQTKEKITNIANRLRDENPINQMIALGKLR